MRSHKYSLVLPCRNEAEHLAQVTTSVPKTIHEILIIDNCSTDDTKIVCKKLAKEDPRIRYIADPRQKNGIGYGYAIMTGLTSASGDTIIIADGDGSYPFSEIKSALKYMRKQNLDFISCARYPVHSNSDPIPLKLRLGTKILNIWTRILYGYRFNDILSGMMIIDRKSLSRLHLTAGDWNMSPQLKIESRKHLRAGEFQISQQSRLGKTKQNYLSTGINHLLWLLKNRIFNR